MYTKDTKSQKATERTDVLNNNSFFQGDLIGVYLFKKSERISSALHLVTNGIKDKEPIKRTLKDTSLHIMSLTRQCIGQIENEMSNSLIQLESSLLELNALLSVAKSADLMSAMNSRILQEEIVALLGVIEEYLGKGVTPSNPALERQFFTVPRVPKVRISEEDIPINIQSTREKEVAKKQTFSPPVSKGHTITPTVNTHTVSTNNSRRERIIEIVRTGGEVSIKDVASKISDWGEKTIQRELVSLVSEGVLIKKGERRWSTYRLA